MARNRAHVWLLLSLLWSIFGFSGMNAMASSRIDWTAKGALDYCIHRTVVTRSIRPKPLFFTINTITTLEDSLSTLLDEWLTIFYDPKAMIQSTYRNSQPQQLTALLKALRDTGTLDAPTDLLSLLQHINLVCPNNSSKNPAPGHPIWYAGQCVDIRIESEQEGAKNYINANDKNVLAFVAKTDQAFQPYVQLSINATVFHTPLMDDINETKFGALITAESRVHSQYIYKVVLNSSPKLNLRAHSNVSVERTPMKLGGHIEIKLEVDAFNTSNINNNNIESDVLSQCTAQQSHSPSLSESLDIVDSFENRDLGTEWLNLLEIDSTYRPPTAGEIEFTTDPNGAPTVGDADGTTLTTGALALRDRAESERVERREQAAAANRRLVIVVLALVFLLVLVLCAIAWTYAVSRRLAREQQEAARRRQKRSSASVPV